LNERYDNTSTLVGAMTHALSKFTRKKKSVKKSVDSLPFMNAGGGKK
jgi:hypothetical protein